MNKQLLLLFILPLMVAVTTQDVAAQTIPVPTQQLDGTWLFTMPDYEVEIVAELLDITVDPLTVTEYKYDGTEKKPAVTAKAGTGSSAVAIESSKCTATYPDDVINVGTKNITEVKVWNNGGGDATVNTSLSYKITPLVIDLSDPNTASLLTITLNPDTYIYDGKEKEPSVTIIYNGTEIPSTEYTVTYQDNINAGTAKAIITDNPGGNYTINATKNFTITPLVIDPTDPNAAALLTITVSPDPCVYKGAEVKPTVSIVYNGIEIPSTEYTVTYENNINVGTNAKAIITDNPGGNYTINATKNFTITPLVIDPTDPNAAALLTITISPDPCIYKGAEVKPTVSIVYNGIEIPSTEYTVTYQNNNNVGTAIVIITDNPNGNYTINATKEFSILPDKIYITAANTDADGTIIADASNKNFCEGKAVVDFTVDNGTPKNYEIEFDGGTIPAQNGALNGSSISISLPKNLAPGVFKGTLVLSGDNGVKTDPMPLKVDVKLPYYTIVTLYNDVAAVNKLSGEFSAYKWTENGSEISGANSRLLQYKFDKKSVYTAILTKIDGNSYETCPLDLSRITEGGTEVNVYPNPGNSLNDVYVEITRNYQPDANNRIFIYNLNGSLIKQINTPQEKNTLQLPSGNYSGIYLQNGEKVPFKLIVK